jgi:general secretion pathway protein A
MYEAFFGLRERPFELTSNARFLLLTRTHLEALSHLEYAAASMRGVTLLIGEAGTGKTTLLRKAFAATPEPDDAPRIACALIDNPALCRNEFFEILAEAFGLDPQVVRSKATFLRELRQRVTELRSQGENSVVVIDEAQSLPMELLEEVRLLGNMESDAGKLIAFVLAGQPEFALRLSAPALQPLRQRVSLRYVLGRLNVHETAAFIAGRIRLAGGDASRLFSREAVIEIHAASGGLPRTISVICDNALLSGFGLGRTCIDRRLVQEVVADFELGEAQTFQPAPAAPTVATRSSAPDVVADFELGEAPMFQPVPAAPTVATRTSAPDVVADFELGEAPTFQPAPAPTVATRSSVPIVASRAAVWRDAVTRSFSRATR